MMLHFVHVLEVWFTMMGHMDHQEPFEGNRIARTAIVTNEFSKVTDNALTFGLRGGELGGAQPRSDQFGKVLGDCQVRENVPSFI
jgi:hypothetical protein